MRKDLEKIFYKRIERLTPVEWAEANRYLTKEISNYDGYLNYDMTPYLREIANIISEDWKAQVFAIKKGSQLGFSIAGLLTQIGWIMSQSPGNILFITETDKKIREQMQGPINQMIENSNLSHLIGSHNIRRDRGIGGKELKGRRNKASGDTANGIKFKEGQLYTWSGQNIGNLSSWSIRYGIYDEVDRWKGYYKTAGEFMNVILPRHKSFNANKKLIFGSTPELEETSNIEPIYQLGDKRKYHIPCLHCGELIDLRWSEVVDETHAGIVYKRDNNGRYIENSAEYVCQKCGGSFKETHKYDMYEETNIAYRKRERGENASDVCMWLPTSEPINWQHSSYHISSLYTPLGFDNWNDYARNWCLINPINGAVKVGALHGFMNQVLGECFEERTKELKANKIMQNCRNYDIGEIPDALSLEDGNGEIVLITCAIDLNGRMGESVEEDDVRLDYEVVAWCKNGDEDFVSSYSIDHGSIGNFERLKEKRKRERDGKGRDFPFTYRHGHDNSVWDIFEKEVLYRNYTTQTGKQMRIAMCGVDTGNYTIYANEFVKKHKQCIALKGTVETDYSNLKTDKAYFKKGSKEKLYGVENNRIKDRLSECMNIDWDYRNGISQGIGFMNFPTPSNNKYTYRTFFHEFEGEKREMQKDPLGNAKGMRWVKKNVEAAQHFWDCRVYNYAVMRIVATNYCKNFKVAVSWDNFCKIILYRTK